ncbi:MAG: hypothetical protein AAGC86_06100 [Pseudomonadota bacterium]
MLDGLTLTPWTAVPLLLVMLFCGRQFRVNWKQQAPGWERRAWIYAVPTALCFAALAFIPMNLG